MAINTPKQTSHLKREILVRLIRAFLSDNFEERTRMIPYDMRPKGHEVPYRCCIYKERAILRDRTVAGLGLSIEETEDYAELSDLASQALERKEPEQKPLTVLTTACKGCVPARIYVTDLCQGCVARPCVNTCKFGAISVQNGKSVIDPAKCKNCGTTFDEFKSSKLFGCAECYETFNDYIKNHILVNFKEQKYLGKKPNIYYVEKEIKNLEQLIEICLKNKNFNKATKYGIELQKLKEENYDKL